MWRPKNRGRRVQEGQLALDLSFRDLSNWSALRQPVIILSRHSLCSAPVASPSCRPCSHSPAGIAPLTLPRIRPTPPSRSFQSGVDAAVLCDHGSHNFIRVSLRVGIPNGAEISGHATMLLDSERRLTASWPPSNTGLGENAEQRPFQATCSLTSVFVKPIRTNSRS